MKKILLSTLTLTLLLPMAGFPADNGKRDWDKKPLLKKDGPQAEDKKGSKLYKRSANPISVSAAYDLYISAGSASGTFINSVGLKQGPFEGVNNQTLTDDSKSIDADVDVLSASIKIFDMFKLSGKVGSGDIKGGRSTFKEIESTLFPALPDLNSEQANSVYTQQTSGEIDFSDFNIHLNLAAVNRAFSPGSDFGFFVGMFNHETTLERSQTNIEVIENFIINEPALTSVQKTSIDWDGYRVGIEGGGISPTRHGFSIIYNLLFAGVFGAEAEYTATAPSGVVTSEKGDGGTGYEFDVNAGVQLFNSLNLFLGYRLLDVTADGSSTQGENSVKSDFTMARKGFYIGAGGSF